MSFGDLCGDNLGTMRGDDLRTVLGVDPIDKLNAGDLVVDLKVHGHTPWRRLEGSVTGSDGERPQPTGAVYESAHPVSDVRWLIPNQVGKLHTPTGNRLVVVADTANHEESAADLAKELRDLLANSVMSDPTVRAAVSVGMPIEYSRRSSDRRMLLGLGLGWVEIDGNAVRVQGADDRWYGYDGTPDPAYPNAAEFVTALAELDRGDHVAAPWDHELAVLDGPLAVYAGLGSAADDLDTHDRQIAEKAALEERLREAVAAQKSVWIATQRTHDDIAADFAGAQFDAAAGLVRELRDLVREVAAVPAEEVVVQRTERMSRIEELIRRAVDAEHGLGASPALLADAVASLDSAEALHDKHRGAASTNPVERVIALRAAELQANRAAAQHQLLKDRLENFNLLFGRVGALPDGRLVTARVGVESPRHVTVVGSTADTEADLIRVLLSAAVSDAEFHESIRQAGADGAAIKFQMWSTTGDFVDLTGAVSVVDGAVLVEGSDGQLYGRRGDETLSAWQIDEALRNGYVDSLLAEKLPQLRPDQRADARDTWRMR